MSEELMFLIPCVVLFLLGIRIYAMRSRWSFKAIAGTVITVSLLCALLAKFPESNIVEPRPFLNIWKISFAGTLVGITIGILAAALLQSLWSWFQHHRRFR